MEQYSPVWVIEQYTLRLLIPFHTCIEVLDCQKRKCTIFLDNSSNFIGSENELRKALEEMDEEKSLMQA